MNITPEEISSLRSCSENLTTLFAKMVVLYQEDKHEELQKVVNTLQDCHDSPLQIELFFILLPSALHRLSSQMVEFTHILQAAKRSSAERN